PYTPDYRGSARKAASNCRLRLINASPNATYCDLTPNPVQKSICSDSIVSNSNSTASLCAIFIALRPDALARVASNMTVARLFLGPGRGWVFGIYISPCPDASGVQHDKPISRLDFGGRAPQTRRCTWMQTSRGLVAHFGP